MRKRANILNKLAKMMKMKIKKTVQKINKDKVMKNKLTQIESKKIVRKKNMMNKKTLIM